VTKCLLSLVFLYMKLTLSRAAPPVLSGFDQDFFLPPWVSFSSALAHDVLHEQPALITFQPLDMDLKAKVVGHRFNSSPLGEM
jgi:hypothetical protein